MTTLDANYVLRYLLQDHKEQYAIAKEAIEHEVCLVLNEVIAEVIYVLGGYYKTTREDSARALSIMLERDNLQMHESKTIVMEALSLYATTQLDYVDCYLCALRSRYRIATFDRQLLKCIQAPSI
jgi:predicted nucleic-acid-binding protein